jgi:hypothetical protein
MPSHETKKFCLRQSLPGSAEMMAEEGTWLASDELPLGGETHGRDEIADGKFARGELYADSAKAAKTLA